MWREASPERLAPSSNLDRTEEVSESLTVTALHLTDGATDERALHLRPVTGLHNGTVGKARAARRCLHAAHRVSVDIAEDKAENALRNIREVHLNTEAGGK